MVKYQILKTLFSEFDHQQTGRVNSQMIDSEIAN
jgi:hypothetical protein